MTGLRDLLSIIHVGIAILAVGRGGGGSNLALFLVPLLVLLAFRLPPQSGHQKYWTALVAIVLAGSVARVLLFGELVDPGIDFLLFMIVQRFFNREKVREHLQLLLLSAILIVVASVIHTGLDFIFIFCAYLIFAVLSLMINMMLGEAARLGPRVEFELKQRRRRDAPILIRSTLSVSLASLIAGTGVFLIFPRFGIGVFLRGSMAEERSSGFSDEVALGEFGTIKTDTTVVARLQPPEGSTRPKQLDLHFRMTAFDRYDEGRWHHTDSALATPLPPEGGAFAFREGSKSSIRTIRAGVGRTGWRIVPREIEGFSASGEGLSMRVVLEDLGTEHLLAASTPLAVKVLPRGPLESRVRIVGARDHQILALQKGPGSIQYQFFSRIGVPTREELENIGAPVVDPAIEPYLQLPANLSPEFFALAKALRKDATSRVDIADAVMQHLSRFAYSTDLEPTKLAAAGGDPIEAFLFESKRGHCEYFASSFALLARAAGVPTRVVNGFLGARYNELGGYYSIRQAEAHSWAEVYFDDLGWVVYDPTPPSGRGANDAGIYFPEFRAWLDALQNRYLEFVVDYDFGKQIALLRQLGVPQQSFRKTIRESGPTVLGIIGAFVLLMFVARRARHWRPQVQDPITRAQHRVYRALARAGFSRTLSDTPQTLANKVSRVDSAVGFELMRFANQSEALRFGIERASSEECESIRERANALCESIQALASHQEKPH